MEERRRLINRYYLKDKMKLFLMLFFLIAGIILPSFVSIRSEAKKEVTSRLYDLDLVGEIIKGSNFEEKIYVPGHVKKYGIMFATYNRKNSGKIRIEIIQGDKKNTEIVDVSTIKDNDYYYLNMKGLKTGEAILRVEGIDGSVGNAVSMHKTSDKVYGELIQNGYPQSRGLVHNMEFYEYSNIVKGQIIFTVLSILCYIYFLSLLREENKNNKKIYMTTVLLIYLVVASRAPVLTFKAEPFAEQVFNFLYNGRTYGIIKNLTMMEGGYLPLYHRIIGLAIIKLGLNAKWTVYLMSNVAILVLGMMVSVFMLKEYKRYGDIFYRFTVCSVFGMFSVSSYIETHTFITFSYLNIVLLFYISLLDLREMKKRNYLLLMILVFLLSLSKFLYVVLLPISIGLLIILWKKTVIREKIYLGLMGIAGVIQIIYTYWNIRDWKAADESEVYKIVGRGTIFLLRPKTKLKVLEAINITVHQVVQQIVNIFDSSIDISKNIFNQNMLYLLIFIFIIGFLLYIVIKNKDRESIVILSLLGIIFGISNINVLARIWSGTGLWENSIGSINTWHSILIKVSIISIIALMPYILEKMGLRDKNADIKKILCYIIGMFLIIRFSPYKNETIFRNDIIAGDWNIYSKYFDKRKYLLPVEPFYTSENERISYVGREAGDNLLIKLFQGEKYYIKKLNDAEALYTIDLPRPMIIEYVYVKRVRNYNFERVILTGYSKKGEKVLNLLQLNKKERGYIGFVNKNPKEEITRLEFITETNNAAFIIPEVYIGEPLN